MKNLRFVTFVSSIFFLLIYAHTGGASHQLRISALGRFASLGEIYDIRNDLFTGENIFEDLPPRNQSFIEITTLERTSTKAQIIRNLWDKVRLMGIELPQAVNILDGSILPKGTSKYLLHSKGDAYTPEAATFHTTATVKATLKLFRKSMAPIIDHETLERSTGTHVVVGISYGMNVIFSLRATTIEIDQNRQQNQLLEILQDLPSKYNETFNRDLKFKIFSDFYFPPENIPQYDDTSSLVRSLLNKTSQGKGVPLKYFLLPLEQIKNYFGIQTPSTNFTPIDGILMEKILKNFDSILNTRVQLHSEPLICYSDEDQNAIQNFTNSFEKNSENFQSEVKETLTSILSKELAKSSLTELLDSYTTSFYSPRNTIKSFEETVLETLSASSLICKTLVKNGVEYLQKRSNLKDIIVETREKSLFVLFFNSSLIYSEEKAWEENLRLLLKLKKPWNRVLAVDCEVFKNTCRGLNKTLIRQYLDLQMISNNLLEDLRQNQMSATELQIAVVGTPRNLGDLYDATSGTFIHGSSIFRKKHSVSLLSRFEDNTVMYRSIVTSNKWQQFLQDLKIPQDQKLLILREEIFFQNGVLKNFIAIRNDPQALENFLLHTNIYQEEYLNFDDQKENWQRFIDQKSIQSRATHFVQKIFRGSTTLVGIIHPNPQQELNLVNQIKTIFDENLKRIENQRAVNLTNLFENIDPLTKFLILSDNQISTPGKIYDIQRFQEFLANFSEISSQVKKPVGYILAPVESFQDFGLLPKMPQISSPLSQVTSEKIIAALDLLEDTSTQNRILSWKEQIIQNSACILETEQNSFDTFAKDLENTTKNWKSTLHSNLDAYRKRRDEDYEEIFSNFSTSFQEFYSEIEEKEKNLTQNFSLIREKIDFCKFCRESSVKYISSSVEHNLALLGDTGKERIYLMFYRQGWVQTMRDIWFQNHVKFFQTLKPEPGNYSARFSQRYLVDCDFFLDASDETCANISQPTIHEYKNGQLVSRDVVSTIEQEQMANEDLLGELQVSHQKFYLETVTNFNSINSTLSALTHNDDHNNGVLRKVFIDSVLRNPHAKLFTEANKTGNFELYDFKSATITGGCYNLKKYQGKIKSVETDGYCVRVFSDNYCDNWSQAMYPGSTNIPRSKLNGVHSIGPCVTNEFEHSTIIESTSSSAPPQLEKLPSSLISFANVPDLIGDAETRSGFSSLSTTSNPVTKYLLGPGNRVEALYGYFHSRHVKSPASAENARIAGLQQSFYSKLELGEDDEPGFAFPLELSGPADQIYNVFPQSRKQAAYFKEKIVPSMKQMLTDNPSHDVWWYVNFVYKNSTTARPSGMWYQCDRGNVEIFYGYVPNSE